MEPTSKPPESAPVSDSAAEKKLAEFVEANRQHLPPLPQKPEFGHLSISPESESAISDREARDAARAGANLRAEIRQRASDLVNAAGNRYRDCTLENFATPSPQQRKVVTALGEYISADCQENVILYGPVGTGKDHLAFALCKSAVKSGRAVKWVNGQAWFGVVRDAMDTDKSEASLIAEHAKPDVLCLSDPLPPVGPLTPFQTTMLYRLVDARYSRGLPTICTINVHDNGEADERMGAATWDRLCHGAWKLFCNWDTYRQPAREV